MSDVYRKRWRRRRIAQVIERDGPHCWLCGQGVAVGQRTLDHVIPKSFGGTNDISNLALAHLECNCARGNDITAVIVPMAVCLGIAI